MQSAPLASLSFIRQILPNLLAGAVMTMRLSAIAIVLGTAVGLMVALAKMSAFRPLRWLGSLYTWVIRGVPLLLQLMFLYYGLAFAGILMDAFTVAVLGLSICAGAYIAEIIRAAVLSVDGGQMQAALAMGMSRGQAMRRVILPQTYRRLIPPMANEFITLMKDSALVSVICMTELLRSAMLLQNATFRPVEVFSTAAAVYLILTTVFTLVFGLIERRLAAGGRGI